MEFCCSLLIILSSFFALSFLFYSNFNQRLFVCLFVFVLFIFLFVLSELFLACLGVLLAKWSEIINGGSGRAETREVFTPPLYYN